MINILQGDCMDLMAGKEDNYYDLAIVDPPYGINIVKDSLNKSGIKNKKRIFQYDSKEWDNKKPDGKYFKELFRVSKNQIIWGANYFIDYLSNTKCFIIWDKIQEFNGSDFELAWTSFDKASKAYRKSRVEFHNESKKIHPTQKSIALYKWLLKNYAKEGDKILDTHGGSMSSAIACHDMKFDLDIIELDKDYYNAGKLRYENHIKQLQLF